MPRPSQLCLVCGEARDYICERCLRCESCCAQEDRRRNVSDQHLGKYIWSVFSQKGVQLVSLLTAGHPKGDFEGLTARDKRVDEAH